MGCKGSQPGYAVQTPFILDLKEEQIEGWGLQEIRVGDFPWAF